MARHCQIDDGLLRSARNEDDPGSQTHLRDLAARTRVFLYAVPSETSEAAGNAGRSMRRSLACKIKKHTSIVTTVTPDSPGIPYAVVLTVSFGISPVIGLVVTVAGGKYFHRLDASVEASGPHDFAVRVSAVRPQHI